LYELADDDDMQVRYQLAFTLGAIPPDDGQTAALVKLARQDGADRWVRFALLTSLRGVESFESLLADEGFRRSDPGQQVLIAMAMGLGQSARATDAKAFRREIDELSKDDDPLASMLVNGFAEGVLRSGHSPHTIVGTAANDKTSRLLAKSLANAKKIAADEKRPLAARVRAVGTLVFGTFDESRTLLASLLDQRQPQELQQAVLAALEKFREPGVATLLLDAWPTLGPRMRVAASDALFARPERLLAMLDAIEKGSFQPGELESPRVQFLLSYPKPEIRDRAQKLLSSIKLGRRQDVVDSYRSVLSLHGDAARGKATFQKICAACHRADGVGHEIGPNLATVKNRGAEFILFNVLDPSREVNPQYVNYMAVTDDGRTLSGMIATETATSITLKRAENATDTILRANLEELRSTGLSIMPEGLEKQIDRQTMADVIAYLLTLK
jgi:putative heme-binding domain-containing protein